ncbi:hypothetical protein OHB26_05735 [Nocardia sp. NBC_01503]|uniref:hypothetical protein n=1 Tax=Nocardia sp. NBC_01503 TaxID=2975997 RepID=UPI002E7BCDB4|nr:hypothetical protein [Nocardia sp. NBC_01503]WTL33725.1 hypothetical protein OHB26_05735 [Nocardia sp. NBC_01503]
MDPSYRILEALDGVNAAPSTGRGHGGMLTAIRTVSDALHTGSIPEVAEWNPHSLGSFRWAALIGRIEVAAVRAISPIATDLDRTALLSLLETWAETTFADRTAELRVGTVAAQDVVAGTAGGYSVRLDPRDSETWLFVDRRTGESGPPPLGVVGKVAPRPLHWGDADQLRAVLALVDEHGPVTEDPDAVELLSHRTGLTSRAARLALWGHIGTAPRHKFKNVVQGMTTVEVDDAALDLSQLHRHLGRSAVPALYTGLLPADPAELWKPHAMRDLAERLADAWIEQCGRQRALPESTCKAAVSATAALHAPGSSQWGTAPTRLCRILAAPDELATLTVDVRTAPEFGTAHDKLVTTTDDMIYDDLIRLWQPLITMCRWAYGNLPAGDPVRAGIPRTLELLRARMRNEDLLIRASGADTERIERLRHAAMSSGHPDPLSGDLYDDGVLVAWLFRDIGRTFWNLTYRPAHLTEIDDELTPLAPREGRPAREFLGWLFGEDADQMIARSAPDALPAGGYEADPTLSAPQLVSTVSKSFDIDSDAAALYLQILALPAPTDRNVRTWNRWKPARHRQAVAVLLAAGLVVEDTGRRAGRTVFLPGAWTAKPGFETWKHPLYLPVHKPNLAAPTHPIPWVAMPALFDQAWRRALRENMA